MSTGAAGEGMKQGGFRFFQPLWEQFMEIMMKIITSTNMWVLRKTKGRFGYSFLGREVLVLKTTGCKSGRRYDTPLYYLEDGERVVLVASRAGTARDPGWLLNLDAAPDTFIRTKQGLRAVRAHRATPEEKAQLWGALMEMFPKWEMIQEKSQRFFPVVILEPRQERLDS